MKQRDDVQLASLRDETVRILQASIGNARHVALLDMPNQRNVGDSLIWAGEVAYLRRLDIDVRYSSDISGYSPEDLRKAMPKGVVLLHGGGNFGDLWPGHQKHREQIARDLPDYKIVQLPQSVYFGAAEAAASANEILSAHPDFTLLLRDRESIERATQQLPDIAVRFCYDMALGFSPKVRPNRVLPQRVLVIAREDVEKSSGLAAIGPDWLPETDLHKTDWGAVPGFAGLRWRLARAVARLDHRLVRERRAGRRLRLPLVHKGAERAIATINTVNIDYALKIYGPARLVVVDRLHAHVLAGLLGIDHIALDNNYRKIGSVFDEYTGSMSTAHYATSLDEARNLAVRLLED